MQIFFALVLVVATGAAIILFVAAVFGFPVMWLWNWLIPDIFGLKPIGFWQAAGLMVLSGLLFKTSAAAEKK